MRLKVGDKVRIKNGLVHGENLFEVTRIERERNFKGNKTTNYYYIDDVPIGYRRYELEAI